MFLGSRTVAPLATNGWETASVTVIIPASQTPGNYYVLAVADTGNVAAEANETNNVRAKTMKINP